MQKQYLYWVPRSEFEGARALLKQRGHRVRAARLTPCEVMNASGDQVIYASPEVWPRVCRRQSTWYQSSRRAGQFMMMTTRRLPGELDGFLDAELTPSDFWPEKMPSRDELQAIVNSEEYQEQKPEGWEAIGVKDTIMFKLLFTLTRFWGRGDNLKRHWLGHRANHANFVARHFTTKLDGEEVPYSVTSNASVCSSCAEFFNVVEDGKRKLVQSCPGSVIFGSAPKDVYVDVKPTKIVV